MTDAPLIDAVRPALEAVADPSRAAPMAAYMKGHGRFLGVGATDRKAVQRRLFGAHRIRDPDALVQTAAALWARAEFREEQYLAVDLLRVPRHEKHLDARAFDLVERMIVEGAWWDVVDACMRPLGRIVRGAWDPLADTMRAWAEDPDLWRRRAAILFQLGAKAETDFDRLTTHILVALQAPGLNSPLEAKDERFFVRKAAGWALRDYARTAPDRVRVWVEMQGDRLPGLTRREALKHL